MQSINVTLAIMSGSLAVMNEVDEASQSDFPPSEMKTWLSAGGWQ